jgi:hypothetical protein
MKLTKNNIMKPENCNPINVTEKITNDYLYRDDYDIVISSKALRSVIVIKFFLLKFKLNRFFHDY